MTAIVQTQSMNIVGSGFYPGGSVSFTITTSGNLVTSYNTSADGTGGVNYSIPVSGINGLTSATFLKLYATDMFSGLNSNTVAISITYTQETNGWINQLAHNGLDSNACYVQSSQGNSLLWLSRFGDENVHFGLTYAPSPAGSWATVQIFASTDQVNWVDTGLSCSFQNPNSENWNTALQPTAIQSMLNLNTTFFGTPPNGIGSPIYFVFVDKANSLKSGILNIGTHA